MSKKLKKSFIIMMIFLVLIVSISAISAADAENINETASASDEIVLEETDDTLESTSDENILSADGSGTFTDLNNNLTGKTEVTLESDYSYSEDTDSAYKNGITVDRELTINGNGHKITGNNNKLFEITNAGSLILKDLVITSTYTGETANDMLISNSGSLTFENVNFTVERELTKSGSSNYVSLYYNTIVNNANMIVKNSVFKDSSIKHETAFSSGSTNTYYYGLIYNNGANSNLEIENTTFDNNQLSSSLKIGNTMSFALLIHNEQGTAKLYNTLICNNYVNYDPQKNPRNFKGIIYNNGGTLEIQKSTIKDNILEFPSENTQRNGIVNSVGGFITLTNSIIMNNSFENKEIEASGTGTLDNNYWGTNDPDFSKLTSGITPSNKVVLTFTPEELTTGQEKTFEIAFKVNDEIITTLPDYTLTVNSEKLGLKDIEIKNGVGQYNYLPITAGEDTVTINGQEYVINVNAAPAGTFTDLKNLIEANDEVNLYSNYTYTSADSALQTGIPINKEVTINGNGYTINSTDLAQMFNIGANGKLTLKNVVLIADYASATGNIINEGTLTMDEVTLTSAKTNVNTELGATIVNKGTLTIQKSDLIDSSINNEAANAIIYGLIYNEGTATIEETLINNNNIQAATKGLIYNKGKLSFKNNLVNNTKSSAIYTEGETAETLIDNSNFENTANSQAIYVASGSVSISNTIFINNDGAIYSNGTLTATTTIFKNNNANEGGAIYTTGSADIQNSIFEKNTATTGQAIYSTGTLNANNNYWATNTPDFETLIHGTTPQNYVIIKIEGSTSLIPESKGTYTVNFKTNDDDTLCELPDYEVELNAINTLSDESVVVSKGSASFTYFSTIEETTDTIKVTVDSNEITSFEITIAEDANAKGTFRELNRLIGKSNEINLVKDYTFDSDVDSGLETGITINKEVTINGHGFTINSTSLAKLLNVVSGGKLTLNDVVLETDYVEAGANNNIYTSAGFINRGDVALNNVTFTTHQYVTSTEGAFTPPIYNAGTFTIENSKFIDSTINTNTQNCFGLIYNTKTLNIEHTIFDKNSIADTSTASTVYLTGLIYNTGTTTLTHVNITNNDMKTYSTARGLIRAYTSGKLIIDYSIFENNTVESTSNKCNGVAIYAESGTMTISNSKFIKNTGALSGGAIYASIAATYDSNLFERNSANEGGAIYSTGSSTTVTNNIFKDNTASSNGGALYSKTALQSSASCPFKGNVFIGNNATNLGGALYSGSIGVSTSTKVIPSVNNTFIDNYAGEKGGALYLNNGKFVISQSTFINNTAGEGVVLYTTSTSTESTITYSLFDSNNILSTEGGLFYCPNTPTANYNYWGTNTPIFNDLIKVKSGSPTVPTNIIIITIEGNTTLNDRDNYTINFKDNVTGDIVKLADYTVDIVTTSSNTVTPSSVVISEGCATFTYNAEDNGEDTIKVMKNDVEITKLDITVDSPKQKPDFSIVANNVEYNESLDLTFTVIAGPSGDNIYKWTIFDENKSPVETGYITGGKIVTVKNYNIGNYSIQVVLSDNDEWRYLSVEDAFEVKQIKTEINPIVIVKDDNTVEISINITANNENANVGGSISFEIDTDYSENVENGQVTITTNALAPKVYNVVITYSGDDNYAGSTKEVTFKVMNYTGTFTELNKAIKELSEINLTYDYTFNPETDTELSNGITIDKEVIINGHGFTINSTNLAKLFNIASSGSLVLNDVVLVTDYSSTGAYNKRTEASLKNLGSLTFNKVTFTTNQEVSSSDITLTASIFNGGTFTIENSAFINSRIKTNTERVYGLIENDGTLNIENTLFDNNLLNDTSTESTIYAVGLIYNNEGTLTLTNVNMTNNYIKTTGSARGLIFSYTDSKTIIKSSIFKNNTVDSDGNNAEGTVIYASTSQSSIQGTLTITDSKFIKNTGAKNGGAIFSAFKCEYENNLFENNSAILYGGAIYSSGADSIYKNNTFKDNVAENGGAIYSTVTLQSKKSILFTKNTFIGNNATKNGGAVYVGNSIGSANYPIENNVFINNFAGEKGGAIYSTGTLNITKTLFKENKAGEGAAAFTTGTSSSTITYSLFDENVVTSPTGGLLHYASSSTANYNYWGTNTPNFDELIGTATKPTNIIIITIEGNETLYESDVYSVKFKDNVTDEIVELFNYTVDLTSTLNTVTPASVVISEGSATFTYNADNNGTDTIKVMKNSVEIAKLDIEVTSPKQTPEFSVVANDVNYTESLDITFIVTAGPTGENIYKWSIFSKSGLLETGNVTTDNKIITTKTYNAGNYTIEVKLSDNDEWNDLTVNDTFEIKALQSEIKPTVTVNDDDTVKIDINITSNDQLTDAAGQISFEIDTAYNKTVENGQTNITTNKLSPNTYTVTITYTGDANHAATTKKITFTIKQTIDADDVLNITKSDDNKTYNYTIKLPENAKGNLTVKVGNTTETKALENGEATIILDGLKPGEQEVTVTYTGDDNYKPMTKTDTINVPEEPKQTPEFSIVAGDITYGDALNLTFNITKGPTGENIYKWSIFSKNGLLLETGNVTTDNKIITTIKDVGNYTIQVSLADVEGWNDLTVNDTFEIKNVIDTRSEISDKDINVSMSIPEGTTSPSFTISLPENANGTFTVYVDGTPYKKQLVNGSATITIENLTVGNHNISTAYSGDDNYKGFATENKTLEIPKARLPGGENALNPTTPEGSDSPSYSIKLPSDATGNLTVTVDGKNYIQALVNGSATVTVPKLAPGDHNITVTYTGDDKKYASISKNSIYKVAEPVVKISENKDVTMLYTAKTPYKVLVTVDGKAVTGEKVTITFNGKTYSVTTDKNGYATLKLPDVKPKKAKYTITAEYKGVKVSNKVKVNSIIKAKNLKVKKSKKVNKIKITLKKVNGKILKGKTLKLKIKGKTLKAKTNKKGVATFKVKKNVLKKLKVGKKYKYKVTFGKDTVTKKLTIKK